MLLVRRAELSDVLETPNSVHNAYGDDPAVHERLPRFWRSGFAAGAFVAIVIHEDPEAPHGRFAAAALTMVARPEFVHEVLEAESAGFGETAVRWTLEGRTPWFTPEESSRASAAGGVPVVGLHDVFALAPRLVENPPPLVELYDQVWNTLHRGIRFEGYYRSAESDEIALWLGNTGQRTIFARERPTPARPALFATRRSDLPLIFGTRIARAFSYLPPKLRLAPAHRELLELAIRGATDDEIATALCLSRSAVKKRWIALYDHLDSVAPELFGLGDRLMDDSGLRGNERRRHLLNYIRNHREEMNPQAG